MTIPGYRPRKAEVQPIVELLTAGTFDSPESLAEAVLKQAYESLLLRDWWLTIVKMGDASHGYGLSATETAATQLELGGGFPRIILPIKSAQGHLNAAEERGL